MATVPQPITSLNVVENKVDISDVLKLIPTPELKLLERIGISNTNLVSNSFEWFDDKRHKRSMALGAAYTAGGSALIVDSSVGIRANTILRIGSSIYKVITVTSGTELTVSAIANDADHSEGDTVQIAGHAAKEGQGYTDGSYTKKIRRKNYTEIFSDYLYITGTQQAIEQYIKEDVFAREIAKRLVLVKEWLEEAVIYGVPIQAASTEEISLTGGIKYFIEQNGLNASGAFSEANLKAFIRQIYNAGGYVSEAWMNPATMDNFLILNDSKIIVEQGDKNIGRIIQAWVSNDGIVNLKPDSKMPVGKIFMFNPADVIIKALKGRAVFYEELAKAGDYTKGQVIGEYGVEIHNSHVSGIYTIE